MRTAIVTGSRGQDGSLLCDALRSDGWNVVGVVRPGSNHGGGEAAVDLCDAAAVADLLAASTPDVVFHLAAAHHAAGAGRDTPAERDAMIAVNFTATRVLAECLLAAGGRGRLVFAASAQMYQASEPPAVVTETTVRDPQTFYGHTKSWAVDALRYLRQRHGMDARTAILFNHESPRRPPQFVVRKITAAAARIAAGSTERLSLGNIGARRDWSSAEDVVRALRLMGDAAVPGDYVVASGRLRTVADVLTVAFAAAGLDWRNHTDFAVDEPEPAVVGRPDRLRADLGWEPRVAFDAMIADMVAAEDALSGGHAG